MHMLYMTGEFLLLWFVGLLAFVQLTMIAKFDVYEILVSMGIGEEKVLKVYWVIATFMGVLCGAIRFLLFPR
jgi:hypothetical protein